MKRATRSKRCRTGPALKNGIRLPKRKRIHLAVHRHDNMLYYKRLAPEAFVILTALARRARVWRKRVCGRSLPRSATGVDWTAEIKAWFDDWASLRLVLPSSPKMKTTSRIRRQVLQLVSARPTSVLQSFPLLVVRLCLGLAVFPNGEGKLMDLQRPTEFFQSLGIPSAHCNSDAGRCDRMLRRFAADCAGLCSRLVSIPLTILLSSRLSHRRSRQSENDLSAIRTSL